MPRTLRPGRAYQGRDVAELRFRVRCRLARSNRRTLSLRKGDKMGVESLLLGAAGNETYGTGDRRVLQFLDVLNDGNQDSGVLLLGTGLLLLGCFQLLDFTGQLFVGGQQFAQLNK